MKRLLIKVLVSVLALSLIAGCAKKTESPAPADPKSSETKDTAAAQHKVTLPYLSFDSLDHAYWQAQLLLAQGTIYEGLFGFDDKLNVVPRMAEKVAHSADYKVWTITLKKDRKWSNGDPVTAKDFYASWIRFLSPDLKDAPMWAGNWGQIQNAWAFKSGAVKPEEVGIKLKDDYTIEVTLSSANPTFTSAFTMANSMPIHHKVLASNPNDWWDLKNAVFNGPYVVKEWTKGGDTVLERNPHFGGEKFGNVHTIVLKPFSDGNARMQAFENGEIQYSALDDAAQVEYAKKNAKLKDGYREEMGLNWSGFQWARADVGGPFEDVRVRRAFAMAIDKAAITDKILKGRAVPAQAFTGDKAVLDNVKGLPYDVAAAKKLLEEAGFPNGQGFPEVFLYAPPANDGNMPMIEAVAKMWQENLGVKVTIQNMEWGPYSGMQWADLNKNIKPGYTIMSGAMNFIDPIGLAQNMPHIWWFMEYTPEYKKTMYWAWKDEKAAIDKLEQPGDLAALEKRAADIWARRQKIMEAEKGTQWSKEMHIPPYFDETFKKLLDAYKAAADDKAKLAAWKNLAHAVADEQHWVENYENLLPEGKKALRIAGDLKYGEVKDAVKHLIPLNQLAIDSAWMIPIHVGKITYVVDPKLTGVVQNKLSWGNIFNFNYLTYNP
ncbi:MAG: peptide ABC transporter substrate-binding protein [Bacillota bacterium]